MIVLDSEPVFCEPALEHAAEPIKSIEDISHNINFFVECHRCCHDCDCCGWNPSAAKERLVAFVRKNPEYAWKFDWLCRTGTVKC